MAEVSREVCPKCGARLETACVCPYGTKARLQLVPDTDRLTPEGYRQLIKQGRFQTPAGYCHTCCICLRPIKQAHAGPPQECCGRRSCRWQLKKAYRHEVALKEEWHRKRLEYREQLEREGRA